MRELVWTAVLTLVAAAVLAVWSVSDLVSERAPAPIAAATTTTATTTTAAGPGPAAVPNGDQAVTPTRDS